MPDKWMTVAEAAASLRLHPRTIERRIAGGKIQSRRADDGMLQVLIDLPDTPDTAADTALETVRELADSQVSLATGSASALVKFAQDDAQRAREELSSARQEARRARRAALAGWCVVAAMGLGVCIAVGWTAQKITRANDDVRQLTDYAAKVEREAAKLKDATEREARQLASERDTARQEAQAARLAGAEASGKLEAYVEQHAKLIARPGTRPATRPASLLQRIASALSDE